MCRLRASVRAKTAGCSVPQARSGSANSSGNSSWATTRCSAPESRRAARVANTVSVPVRIAQGRPERYRTTWSPARGSNLAFIFLL